MLIAPIDRDALRDQVRNSQPFPHFCIDNFLMPDFAAAVLGSFPSFHESRKLGREFSAVNEKNKVQITDAAKFPEPILQLHQVLASSEWLDTMSYVMDIPNLLADPLLIGGGIHETGPRGHLDVHVDFNYIKDRQLHRRLNILVYFNKDWQSDWGGNIELWDKNVRICHKSLSPIFNRCVVFATNEISYHGVTAVKCPEDSSRRSFAAYYYTKEAPPNWDGQAHSTLFKARPNERVKGLISMPMERLKKSARQFMRTITQKIKGR